MGIGGWGCGLCLSPPVETDGVQKVNIVTDCMKPVPLQSRIRLSLIK